MTTPPTRPRRRARCLRGAAAPALLLTFTAMPLHAGSIPDGASYDDYDAALLTGVVADTVGHVTYGAAGNGSGVYLGDGWVLTAAHVGDDDLDFDFTIGGTTYASADVFVHPDWDYLNITLGNDLALIKLQQDIPGVAGAAFYTGRTNDLLGDTATIAGYGATGNGTNGADGPKGTFHAGQNRIDRTGQQSPFRDYNDQTVFVDFDDPESSSDGYAWSPDAALPFEYLIGPGDSGGGLFVDTGNGLQLAGVTSFLLALDGTIDGGFGDIGGFFTLDGMLPWIAATTGSDVLISGDANQNGQVEQGDLDAVLQNWGRINRAWATGDLNGNGQVEQGDLDLVLTNWGQAAAPNFTAGGVDFVAGGSGSFAVAAVPEPGAALALLGLGVMRRRRR